VFTSALRDLGALWHWRANFRHDPAKPSGKVSDTHSVGSICDHDLGVFTVTKLATENTDAVLPVYPVPRTPKAGNQGWQGCRAPSVPLTCFAGFAAWQSLCTGHVVASLEIRRPWPSPTWAARSAVADTSASRASERSPPSATARQLVNTYRRGSVSPSIRVSGPP